MSCINISFGIIWDNIYAGVSKSEENILKNGLEFKYDDTTTVRELFLYLNDILKSINNKQADIPYQELGTDKSLQFLYRIGFRKEAMYIFNLNIKLKEIVDYIGSNSIIIVLTLFRGIGGEVYREKGMRFYMHSREGKRHHEPHIHVNKDGEEITINLNTIETKGKMPQRYIKKAKEIVRYNRESFLLMWNTMTDGEKIELEDYQINRIF